MSEHLPVSDAEEHGFYNKSLPPGHVCSFFSLTGLQVRHGLASLLC